MQGDATQSDDTGGVEQASNAMLFLRTQLAFEDGRGVIESAELEELRAPPGFQHVVGPSLAAALCVSDAVIGHLQRLVKPFGDHERMRSHHLRETRAGGVFPRRRRAGGLLGQLD